MVLEENHVVARCVRCSHEATRIPVENETSTSISHITANHPLDDKGQKTKQTETMILPSHLMKTAN